MSGPHPGGQHYRACHCTGPRPGEPVCPCRMSNLSVVNGRWVEIIDHGPVIPFSDKGHHHAALADAIAAWDGRDRD